MKSQQTAKFRDDGPDSLKEGANAALEYEIYRFVDRKLVSHVLPPEAIEVALDDKCLALKSNINLDL